MLEYWKNGVLQLTIFIFPLFLPMAIVDFRYFKLSNHIFDII
jgi:hypothetical protein